MTTRKYKFCLGVCVALLCSCADKRLRTPTIYRLQLVQNNGKLITNDYIRACVCVHKYANNQMCGTTVKLHT